ncbi:MAG: GTP cyclohydrolase II, partial [Ureaplasma sp.]|nr:GTP cyclohydrolase II [Ureaplasma sp.]
FDLYCFIDKVTKEHHLALVKGDVSNKQKVLTRIHSECLTGDAFSSMKCDCGPQLHYAMKKIQENDGVLIYLRQEGRNIGLVNKLKAYSLQEQGLDTVEANLALGLKADDRDYYIASQILKHLNVQSIKLLTNNPDKIEKITNYGTIVSEREQIKIQPNKYDEKYLLTKQEKMGHLLDIKGKK